MGSSNGNSYKCRWCDEEFPMAIIRDIHELKHIEEEDRKVKCDTQSK
jgi:DNA-directed RNA polymerase subunit RPC12/RpoP